jgi:hypothetical protein
MKEVTLYGLAKTEKLNVWKELRNQMALNHPNVCRIRDVLINPAADH